MKILNLNCHRFRNPHAIWYLWRIIHDEGLDLVFLMETKKNVYELQCLKNENGLSNIFGVGCEGDENIRVKGLLLMWGDLVEVEVEVLSFSLHHIDMIL